MTIDFRNVTLYLGPRTTDPANLGCTARAARASARPTSASGSRPVAQAAAVLLGCGKQPHHHRAHALVHRRPVDAGQHHQGAVLAMLATGRRTGLTMTSHAGVHRRRRLRAADGADGRRCACQAACAALHAWAEPLSAAVGCRLPAVLLDGRPAAHAAPADHVRARACPLRTRTCLALADAARARRDQHDVLVKNCSRARSQVNGQGLALSGAANTSQPGVVTLALDTFRFAGYQTCPASLLKPGQRVAKVTSSFVLHLGGRLASPAARALTDQALTCPAGAGQHARPGAHHPGAEQVRFWLEPQAQA